MTAPEPDFLTVAEAAAILRVGTSTVYRRIESGELHAYHLGPLRIDRRDLYAFLRQARSGR